jgi:hypothetical protein
MKYSTWRWSTAVFAIGLFASLSSGCVVSGGGGGYGYDGNVGVGLGYYEPAGVEYGGWGRGYRVAPYRGGDDHRTDRTDRSDSHAHGYRSAPASHSAPSIPSRSRGRNSRPERPH